MRDDMSREGQEQKRHRRWNLNAGGRGVYPDELFHEHCLERRGVRRHFAFVVAAREVVHIADEHGTVV